MRRGWKILIVIVVALAVLLTLNTIAVNNETKSAGVTVKGGRILHLPGGDLQVAETGPTGKGKEGAPIVLIHCYACSVHWWDRMVPILARHHRVIRIDLLGHGGSEKPASGYAMDDQAGLVGQALNELHVEGAVVVGHSLGATVATALADQSSELVDRVVDIDKAPDNSDAYTKGFPFLAKLGYVPVLGQFLNRVTPDFAVKDGYEVAFAPGYDISSGFDNSDQVVDDFNAMTYTSYNRSADDEDDYVDRIPLNERLTNAAIPLMVIFGSEDQLYDAEDSIAGFQDVPGVRTATVDGAGHSPNVEKPDETARLVLQFAAEAGDEALSPEPRKTKANHGAKKARVAKDGAKKNGKRRAGKREKRRGKAHREGGGSKQAGGGEKKSKPTNTFDANGK
jgi:pimeloyl-ACP methyl ester carboxylesterase